MPRLTIFAKGNLDLRDALHACREGGAIAWNGINAAIRARHPGWTARLIHETMTRSDALLACPRPRPEAVADLPLGDWSGQFGTALFDTGVDAVLLSIQPDVMTHMARHRGDGHLLYPHAADRWDAAARRLLVEQYGPAPPLTPEESMANLAAVIARLPGDPQVLVCNLSAHVPGERVRGYRGLAETLGERIRRFNLALIGLSRETGAAIVDVDAILAREGAAALKLDALHLRCAGARLVAEEVVAILEERGCFAGGGGGVRLSVVVRTRDEAPRLRLTLAALEGQGAEVVVVNDGSADATPEVLAGAAPPLTVVAHAIARGRAAAANAGAAAARGDVLLFLDGDTLAGPGTAAAHLAAHRDADRDGARIAGRGETWHLRAVRDLADPEAGTPWPGAPPRPPEEFARARITREAVRHEFASVAARAAPGVYPGAAPRRLHELEMAALREGSAGAWGWAAASGSNFSVRRADFERVGGFDPALDINEHRELALRLRDIGVRVAAVEGARTYHLIHRRGWRDPLIEPGWEAAFRAAHPDAPLDRLKRFWAGVADGREMAIPTLAALGQAAG